MTEDISFEEWWNKRCDIILSFQENKGDDPVAVMHRASLLWSKSWITSPPNSDLSEEAMRSLDAACRDEISTMISALKEAGYQILRTRSDD